MKVLVPTPYAIHDTPYIKIPMAKDYFQDILQNDAGKSVNSYGGVKKGNESGTETQNAGERERSIRNITVNARTARARGMSGDVRDTPSGTSNYPSGKPRHGQGRLWIWVVAAISVVVLIILALFAFRSTTINVTPRSRPIAFDQNVRFIASPSASAAVGALSYSVVANDFEDSEVVPSKGTERAEERASGTIEVFNSYSASTVRLIKNTRFATPNGLVFRVPATVVIPGKKGSIPGSVTVTVAADQAGEEYNIGPVDKFTLPGLKTSPDMYVGVYARSTSSFTGGFIGERPAVAAGTLDAAKTAVRGRLESKARESVRAQSSENATVFPDLMRITYQSLPTTAEAGGGVRIHEKAHMEIPVMPADVFAKTTAQGVGENTEGADFALSGLDKIVAQYTAANAVSAIGKEPIEFTLSGNAVLIWNVDSAALSEALSGRDQGAFQGIINGFPSIQEARARIEPFWKGTFPASPSDIVVKITPI